VCPSPMEVRTVIRLHEIGASVRARREEVGLSTQQLAAFSEMDAHILTELESGTLPEWQMSIPLSSQKVKNKIILTSAIEELTQRNIK